MDKLISSIEKGVLYSGYILCGNEISKALEVAKDMAVAAKTTPYIIEEPSMEKIRSLQISLYEDVQKGDAKIAIIYGNDLSDRCQNAMLKTIEEYPGSISIIFVITNLSVMLPTIISRCILVYPKRDTEKEILEEIGQGNSLYARYCGNSLKKAKELMADSSFIADRNRAVEIMQTMYDGKPYVFTKDDAPKIVTYVNYIQLFLRDALTKDIFWFFDYQSDVESYINSFTTAQIIGIIKVVQGGAVRIYKKANPQLTFDMVQLAVLEVINERSNRG